MSWLAFWFIGAIIAWVICICFILDSYAELDLYDWAAAFTIGLTSWLFILVLVITLLYGIFITISDAYKIKKLGKL